jgi:hypothetical protein
MYLDNLTTPLGSFSDTINYAQNDITIGSYYAGTGANTIDEFSVFNSTSSLTSVAALASGGKPANLSSYDPVAWIRMGDDSNDSPVAAGNITGITDSSGNGNDATQSTASSQPTFKALAQSTTSVSFDGSDDSFAFAGIIYCLKLVQVLSIITTCKQMILIITM